MTKFKNRNALILFFLVTHFTIISGFRAVSVGTDTFNYNTIFSSTSLSSVEHIIQNSRFVGYELLMKLIGTFPNGNYQIFLLLIAFLTNFLFLVTIYRVCSDLIYQAGYLYYILYYFISTMNITRQMFAVSLCFCSIYYLIKKKYLKYFLLVLCAFLIHSTAVTAFIFPILYKVRWNYFKYALLVVMTILIGRGSSLLMGIFSTFVRGYSIYENAMIYQNEGNRIYLTLFLTGILFICIFFSLQLKNNFSQSVYFFQAVIIISVVMGIIFAKDSLIIRAQQYFEITIILYFPLFYRELKDVVVGDYKKYTSILRIAYIIFFVMLLIPFLMQLYSNYGGIIPYKTGI
ncbi:EpsG family protein [Enterococcus malodoratus]|nr:EpsG family protein [Enterococcus malodoratus]